MRDLLDGTVPVAGVDLTVLRLPIEEIFYRFTFFREFDVSEMSFAKIVALASQDDRRFVAAAGVSVARLPPLVDLRAHRRPAHAPAELAGKRIGVPEWAQTAAVYSRGMLAHEHGVDLASIHWYQAGVNEPGRGEKVGLRLPAGFV